MVVLMKKKGEKEGLNYEEYNLKKTEADKL